MDIACSSPIVIVGVFIKYCPKQDVVIQWHTQAENITTSIKVEVDFTLPPLCMANVVTWECPVYESDKGRYDMIL